MRNTEILEKTYENLQKISDYIESGKIGIIHTDNFYGFIINGNSESSAREIYNIKGRDNGKPLCYSTNKLEMDKYGVICEGAQKISERWPAPISFIVKKTDSVPDYITSGLDSVLLVCIDDYTEKLSSICNVPIAATSANLSGEESIVSFNNVFEQFNGVVDFIVRGDDSCRGQATTVVNFSKEKPFIQRTGPVNHSEVIELIGDIETP